MSEYILHRTVKEWKWEVLEIIVMLDLKRNVGSILLGIGVFSGSPRPHRDALQLFSG